MTSPVERPAVPYGLLDRRAIMAAKQRCLIYATHRRMIHELCKLVDTLADRIEENEEIIAAGSPPGDGPRRLEP